MFRSLFYRNVRARDDLELFLVSAVSSLLLLRFILNALGYPQLGGSHLHIAHMLYGGLLMAAAILMQIAFLGARVQRVCALIGGVGFGIFIDELGKFITRDNNYFFRPTVGLIYAVFIALYLVANFLSRDQHLTTREYELNALNQLEEAVLRDLDAAEKHRIYQLLRRGDQKSPLTQELLQLLGRLETVPTPRPSLPSRLIGELDKLYGKFWRRRASSQFVAALFLVEALLFLGAVLATLASTFDNVADVFHVHDSYAHRLIIGQLVSSLVAGGFALAGAMRLTKNRQEALELFRRATLINLFLTEFFLFSRVQFGAIPSFLINLGLLGALHYALQEERRSHNHATS